MSTAFFYLLEGAESLIYVELLRRKDFIFDKIKYRIIFATGFYNIYMLAENLRFSCVLKTVCFSKSLRLCVFQQN